MSFRQSTVDVYLGAHNVRLATEEGREIITYVKIFSLKGFKTKILFSLYFLYSSTNLIVHPNWRPATLQGDIALIKLPRKVVLTGMKKTI